jgi:hypothetical protein
MSGVRYNRCTLKRLSRILLNALTALSLVPCVIAAAVVLRFESPSGRLLVSPTLTPSSQETLK